MKCWAGWSTSWNQDYQEKYQQPQICTWYHPNGKNEEELKRLLVTMKEENEKVGFNSTFRKLRSWHLDPSLHGKEMGKQWKQWQTLFWGAPKSLWTVTAATKLKRCFLLERKAMTNLGSVLKSRDNALPTKVHLVKAIAFPVVTHRCESWTRNKAEHQRIDAF